jgi:ABC-type proline/glycine betaine transport system permease subunit
MTTNTGLNWQAVMWLAMSAVTTMDSGIEQKILLGIAMVVMAIVAWRTTGSGLTRKESEEILDTTADIQDVLKQGRDEN